MNWPILIPQQFQKFSTSLPAKVIPIYYRCKSVPLQTRLKRKLGFSFSTNVFGDRIELLRTTNELNEVKAMWIDSRTVFSEIETVQLLKKLPQLRWLYSERKGTDHLQAHVFESRDVKVSNTGNLVSAWVAQMGLACIMAQSKHLPEHIALKRTNQGKPIYCEDLSLQKVAIIGTGNIGNELARLCKLMGMHVIGLSRKPETHSQQSHYDQIRDLFTGLEGAISEADYIVLTLPLNQETKEIMSKSMLGVMKSTASLINLARPRVVNESALLASLANHAIAAAYIGRLDEVSIFQRLRASQLSNLIITHNSEAHVREKDERVLRQFVGLLEKVMEGGEVEY